jgi:hypothetical protein
VQTESSVPYVGNQCNAIPFDLTIQNTLDMNNNHICPNPTAPNPDADFTLAIAQTANPYPVPPNAKPTNPSMKCSITKNSNSTNHLSNKSNGTNHPLKKQ